MKKRNLRAALVRLLWRSVADLVECSCEVDDRCPECEAMQALGLGRWTGPAPASALLLRLNLNTGLVESKARLA